MQSVRITITEDASVGQALENMAASTLNDNFNSPFSSKSAP